MRVRLSSHDRHKVFTAFTKRIGDVHQIADIAGVSTRTVADWRRGKFTIPRGALLRLLKHTDLELDGLTPKLLDDSWHSKAAGKKGGTITIRRHGPLGTPASRKRGGQISYTTRRNIAGDIFTPKTIRRPRKSKYLAEFIGILIGDGGVTKYQVVVSTNAYDDYEYSQYIQELAIYLFRIKPRVSVRFGTKAMNIVFSSSQLVNFLKSLGIHEGNKLKQGLDIPAWVLERPDWANMCLRGIFDTDGCIFQERHKIKGKIYNYPRLSFVSMSPALRQTIHKVLEKQGLNPRIRGDKCVNLELRDDITKYFKIVGTSNPKHLRRFQEFGEVG